MTTPDPRILIGQQPVIPVLTIRHLAEAVPLAEALVRGGLPVIEVTMRTAVALDAIRAIVDAVPGAKVGAGTILSPDDLDAALKAGSRFIVSPGTPASLADALADCGIPVLPGAGTVSEAMALRDRGFSMLKFFPAEPSGGVAWLKAVAGPLGTLAFCPTGGIDLAKAPQYLALPNVPCLGGSWVAPDTAIASGDWSRIEALARQAAALRS